MKTRTAIMSLALSLLMGHMRLVQGQTINASIIDPAETYAGHTYAEWAAGFWQYYMKLPATNNPFVANPSYVAPLSTGQSGPVWFLCGNYAGGGIRKYTNTIPGGVALFAGITDIERDNSGCPQTDLKEAQLRASAKAQEDTAKNMLCTIDGVNISGLTNALTSPYRIQSGVFDYTCPPAHSVLEDTFGDSCEHSSGTPITVQGAVEDGIFLLIAPLSAGLHVIHTECKFPGFTASFTHYLTIQPVTLAVQPSLVSGDVTLVWPQTPDNYSVETAFNLDPADWQDGHFTATTRNGHQQAEVLITEHSQYFRLKLTN